MDRTIRVGLKHSSRSWIHNTLLALGLLCIIFGYCTHVKAEESTEFLSKEKAFPISVQKIDPTHAKIKLDIAKGYMLYLEHFKFQDLNGQPLSMNDIKLPKAQDKHDEFLGHFKVFTKPIEILLPLPKHSELGFKIQYQGCAEGGFCYPPIAKKIQFDPQGKVTITESALLKEPAPTASHISKNSTKDKSIEVQSRRPQDNIHPAVAQIESNETDASSFIPVDDSDPTNLASLFEGKGLTLTLLAFLGIGIMLSFTPCVLPMVPILANILVGQSDAPLSKKRCLYLAGLYVFSVSLCYAIAGVAAGFLGSHLQTTLQQPLFLVALSFLILLFALNQFNLVHVQFPSIFGNALQQLEQRQKQGSALGAVAMGAISALMVSPCVTPALVGALTYISQTGNALLGGAALFALSLGMGLPLLIVASIGSHLLPKAGAWMKYIKYLTGLFLLVLAVSILFRALPLQTAAPSATTNPGTFITVHDKQELKKLLADARAKNKPVILDVYADWCISCKQMDREIFDNQDVLQKLNKVQLLRFDLTQQTQDSQLLQQELGIIGPPMVLFFDLEGKEVKSYRIAGKSESHHFLKRVNQFLEQTSK